MEEKYYTYIYLDPRKPGEYKYQLNNTELLELNYEPFYVGKGTKDRMYRHKYKSKDKRRQHMLSKINKIIKESNKEPIIIKYKDNLSNDKAYEYEEILVDIIGRINNNTGPLINKTKGGHGSNGFKHSEETLQKMSKSMKQYYKYNNHYLLGKKRSLEICKNISKGRLGIVYDRSTFIKKAKNSNKKPILQYDLNGNFIREWELLTDIKDTLGIHIKNINSCINGNRNVVEGYIWKRKLDSEYPTKIEINFKITKKHA